jgi:hypothetical protein
VEHWKKFNSNSGWVAEDDLWDSVMQALSHFSYHTFGGNLLLCDLQGGILKNGAVLSDPVIMSRNRKYGSASEHTHTHDGLVSSCAAV